MAVDVQPVSTAGEFSSSGGFIELPRSLFRHSEDSEETIEMTVVTDQPNGLLLWQGQTASRSSNSKDFIAVVVDNGKVQFRSRLFGCYSWTYSIGLHTVKPLTPPAAF